jgi:low affinity Fe/Cu permease
MVGGGPADRLSKGWELAVTAGVPLTTLFLLIIVRRTQNHDDRAIELKLDKHVRAVESSSNAMVRAEERDWKDLERLEWDFRQHTDGDDTSDESERGAAAS